MQYIVILAGEEIARGTDETCLTAVEVELATHGGAVEDYELLEIARTLPMELRSTVVVAEEVEEEDRPPHPFKMGMVVRLSGDTCPTGYPNVIFTTGVVQYIAGDKIRVRWSANDGTRLIWHGAKDLEEEEEKEQTHPFRPGRVVRLDTNDPDQKDQRGVVQTTRWRRKRGEDILVEWYDGQTYWHSLKDLILVRTEEEVFEDIVDSADPGGVHSQTEPIGRHDQVRLTNAAMARKPHMCDLTGLVCELREDGLAEMLWSNDTQNLEPIKNLKLIHRARKITVGDRVRLSRGRSVGVVHAIHLDDEHPYEIRWDDSPHEIAMHTNSELIRLAT